MTMKPTESPVVYRQLCGRWPRVSAKPMDRREAHPIPKPHTNKKVNEVLARLPWHEYQELSPWQITRAISKLRELSLASVRTKKQMYYDATIVCLKAINSQGCPKPDPKKHIMTDHAFCRGLERLHGIDVGAMKDSMIERLKKSDILTPAFCEEGYIVTILESYKKRN